MQQPGPQENCTADSVLNGRITVFQEKAGYRFSIDAVLLARFARPGGQASIVDLGTGSGVAALILAVLHPQSRVWGVEIQPALAALAARNAAANHLKDRVFILNHDLKKAPHPALPPRVDLVTSNPPYRELGSGRINPDSQKAKARHELCAELDDVAQAGGRLLSKGGKFTLVYPAARLVHLMTTLTRRGLEPKRLRLVHSRSGEEARLALMEAVKGGGPQLTVEPPLVVYGPDGGYTPETAAMLGWEGEAPCP